jgi:uncharacterized protein DUF2442
MKPVEVNPLQNYRLQVTFEDGISGIIDLTDFIKKGIFIPLQNVALFNKAYVTHSSIAWSEELAIDALTIYAEITKKQPSDIVYANFQHAAD